MPYKNNKTGKYDAQFQLGYKGLIQLAQRSGQFKRLVAVPVYEKQLLAEDPINGFEFDWKQKPEAGEQPIGYYAYFRLLNDFTAELYMTTHEVNEQPPCVLVWENVPGVLSTKDNAFGHLLAGLAQEYQPLQPPGKRWANAGYVHSARTICWRVLDAQYFGVAQRRKRVFLVASARRRSVAQILLEQKSLRGDFNQSQEEGKNSAANVDGCFFGAYQPIICKDKEPPIIIHGTQDPIISQTTAHCLGRNNGQENVLFEIKGEEALRSADKPISPTLKARMGTGGNNVLCIYQPSIIRKLTPTECERLQGFPDNWTQIPYRNKSLEDCPDSPRYKAIGNSMAVPVMRWIGKRLVDYLTQP